LSVIQGFLYELLRSKNCRVILKKSYDVNTIRIFTYHKNELLENISNYEFLLLNNLLTKYAVIYVMERFPENTSL